MSKTTYKFTPNVLTEFLEDYKTDFVNAVKKGYENINGEKQITDKRAYNYNIDYLTDDITDELYLIEPNPVSDFTLIVYEPKHKDIAYYWSYKNTKHCMQTLKKQYKDFMRNGDNEYRKIVYTKIPFDRLVNKILNHYVEDKITEEKPILLNDGIVYSNTKMEFLEAPETLPLKEMNVTYETLTEDNRELLGKLFNIMYLNDNENTSITDYDKFLYYILSLLNKAYAPQTVFIVIDKSKVGKTAKIISTVNLGLNSILKPEMLRATELYNTANNNAIILNESQGDKNIDGSTLNIFADSTPLTTSVKNKNAITLSAEEKPIVNIMGESQPLIKALSDGTNRRFALVPKVNPKFMEYKEAPENKEEITKFYNLLYNNTTQVIEFYIEQIQIHNIIERSKEIRSNMSVTLSELEDLIEIKEEIYERYFYLNPDYSNALTKQTVLIDSKDGLDTLLTYIEENIITINHITTSKGRRNYLNRLIKEATNVKNLKDFGHTTFNKRNYLYAYSLTKEGVKLVKEINLTLPEEKQIQTETMYL